jgi:hypothetical protein
MRQGFAKVLPSNRMEGFPAWRMTAPRNFGMGRDMRLPSSFHIAFLAFNLAVGLAVGTATVRSAGFSNIGIPTFMWPVVGMFAFEVAAGFATKTHPSVLLTMPWRIAGLILSLLACYGTLTAFANS